MSQPHFHFVTGRLAEPALREILAPLARETPFDYTVQVLPITVAALMTPAWIARRIQVDDAVTQVVLPGYCGPNAEPVAAATGKPVVFGPRDLRQLPEFFGGRQEESDYGDYDIEIIAEINHAPRLSTAEVLRQARSLADHGADIIDVGCDPDGPWPGVSDCVKALVDQGHRVSIDSFDTTEIAAACRAGAELVLSVNRQNVHAAADWGREVVAAPDDIATMGGLEETIQCLDGSRVSYRIDPILEPIGFGFAASLERYMEARRRWPQAEMMMGIGNLTELTDVDSAGVNVILLGICQELAIRSVLTTQVINWARSSVRECDLGRRLVHFAVHRHRLPKHVEPGLVALRDVKLYEMGRERMEELARQVTDNNFRLFAEGGAIHLISADLHLEDVDPFELFERLSTTDQGQLDPSHAFYLGYEMAKAVTALTLSKQYRQDEALDWGHLTQEEVSHRERKSAARRAKRPFTSPDK